MVPILNSVVERGALSGGGWGGGLGGGEILFPPPLSPGAVKADYTPSYKLGFCVSDVSAPILLYYTHTATT
jgi:hypothetical protein